MFNSHLSRFKKKKALTCSTSLFLWRKYHTRANFKQPTWCHWTWNWKEMGTNGSSTPPSNPQNHFLSPCLLALSPDFILLLLNTIESLLTSWPFTHTLPLWHGLQNTSLKSRSHYASPLPKPLQWFSTVHSLSIYIRPLIIWCPLTLGLCLLPHHNL